MLQEAILQHKLEQNKLTEIEASLRDTIGRREKLQQNFFLKARSSPCNKREVNCHISSSQKSISHENALRTALCEQHEMVKCAAIKLDIAMTSAIDAQRNLKIIEKHYQSWKQTQRRAEDIREQNENDDQNGVRFLLK